MIIPRTPHLFTGTPPAAVVLPAFPAFTDQPFYDIAEGVVGLTFSVVYTRGAPTGQPVFRYEWGNVLTVPGGGEVSRDVSSRALPVGAPAAVPPNCRFEVCLTEFLGPIPADGSPLTYALPACTIPPGQRKVRLLAAEAGAPLTPGTMLITLTGASP